MSTAILTSLRDYLYGTLSAAVMMWLVEEEFARKDTYEMVEAV